MKQLIALACSLLLCSCANSVVTKSYVAGGSGDVVAPPVDAKDFGSVDGVRFTYCGVGAYDPQAIYIRPFCVDNAVFRGHIADSDGEIPLRKALTPVAFASILKEQLSKIAPARILREDESPRVGWLVDGEFQLVDGGSQEARFFLGTFGAGRSMLLLHVKVTDVETNTVVYEFDVAGSSNLQGRRGTLRASGLGPAVPFDLRNAAERIYLALTPDPFRYGARSSLVIGR